MSGAAAVPRGRRIGGLVRACHPVPAAAVTGLAAAMAIGAGRGPAGTLLTTGAVAAGQLSIGWSNDLIDRQRDAAAGRTDKPLALDDVTAPRVRAATGWAVAACVLLSAACGTAAATVHLAAVATGWAYNLRLKAGPWSWLPYAAAFALLPAFVTLALPGRPWPAATVLGAGALLGVAAHFANVLPDLTADRAAGIRGLPQRLGLRASAALAVLAATAAALLLAPGWPVLAVTAPPAAATLLAPRGRLPFLAVILATAVALGLLLTHGGLRGG
ncbi:UbiA family prenyltransferase [Kitasatospora cheerisanensis]|uniref:UbiA family prenyltransferase n=1 Tax=Kitasatospora cheerisanensis TaxID=81942 RepID=UPI001AD81783|nr:UbiA family prenyltransferase [Kitasatospora cheerisanensis]